MKLTVWVAALFLSAAPLAAQVTCSDGSASKGGRGACSRHGGIDRGASSAGAAARPQRVDTSALHAYNVERDRLYAERVQAEAQTNAASAARLAAFDTPANTAPYVAATTLAAPFRTEPGIGGVTLLTLDRGTRVRVLSCEVSAGAWCVVTYNTTVGFVAHRFFDPAPGALALKAPDSSAAPSAFGAYQTGPKGGCYTVSASGRKRYVSREHCQ